MGKRRKARELALKILFQLDLNKENIDESLKLFWENHKVVSEIKEFANKLVYGTINNYYEIDNLIRQYSNHWQISRMATIDRNILRFAVYELIHIKDIPIKVTINEAIEIAKKYGTEDSGGFVNGILDKISKEITMNKD